MIGQNAITKNSEDVIVIVGNNPAWFKGVQIGIPMVYTQKSRPKPNDLAILKGKRVQLIHAQGTDELFAKWYVEIAKSMPSQLVALDSQGEIFC